MSLDQYGRTQAQAASAHISQLSRARLLWEALGQPMGEAGLRLLEEATASMSVSEFNHALDHVRR
jgi:hypothetical protein